MQWKSIKNYEGYYEVSDSGIVRSLDRDVHDRMLGNKHLHGRIMRLTKSVGRHKDNEYLVVNLRKNGTTNVVAVHRLVAEAFLPNPKSLPTVNHKDGNKQNNFVENLEWVSYTDNNLHALKTGLRTPQGVRVAQIDTAGNTVGEYSSVSQASRITGVSRGMISHCIHNRATFAGGYKWKVIEKCNDYLFTESTAEDELLLEVQELA